ncbi:MAG: molybdenum cofactor biosynthesis protein B [Gammaproteobacteria bacterium]|uniref:Molybdenum cofactor biosynthesis protein B n=1 Tax=OM182 bacterium MED-G24 TaxID=1986255 RepID=A0A2A5WRS0_9GAMM|nr:molybdenum cofactor biosynthesis protein B [Gammaproteobacteria bacterium]PDH39245.1 MAG: molybdenum cofactor biosynthesis protein B [OM182 bacterium MED-G24]RPG25424.1 MAG: molybdenum cofactor biosynthesis protein B [Gammaproteobacteria bacterium TMED50]
MTRCKVTEGLKSAVLTVSDTRDRETDTSGQYLCDSLVEAGHDVVERDIVIDDRYLMRARLSAWIADPGIEVVLLTGGTGFTGRDTTPDAVEPLLDTLIPGFGELFRQLSHAEIGSSTVQSRAIAGVANNTFVFCLPGSSGACRTAWEGILREQLDESFRPCNFAELIRKGVH